MIEDHSSNENSSNPTSPEMGLLGLYFSTLGRTVVFQGPVSLEICIHKFTQSVFIQCSVFTESRREVDSAEY